MDFPLNGVESDGIVRCIWGENCDSRARGEGVDCGFVGFWVTFVVCGVGVEGGVEAVVDLGDIFVEMFA